ncbi:hypothetical protein VTN96DRAFT_3676 [Rasamsonia emersonii]
MLSHLLLSQHGTVVLYAWQYREWRSSNLFIRGITISGLRVQTYWFHEDMEAGQDEHNICRVGSGNQLFLPCQLTNGPGLMDFDGPGCPTKDRTPELKFWPFPTNRGNAKTSFMHYKAESLMYSTLVLTMGSSVPSISIRSHDRAVHSVRFRATEQGSCLCDEATCAQALLPCPSPNGLNTCTYIHTCSSTQVCAAAKSRRRHYHRCGDSGHRPGPLLANRL